MTYRECQEKLKELNKRLESKDCSLKEKLKIEERINHLKDLMRSY